MDIPASATRIGTLADPTRYALYELVCADDEPITRDTAADRLGIAPHAARFHLDRLVEAGLVEVEFRRLSGRTGPGAGRPAKVYRRSSQTHEISLPGRRYDLAGHLLARAIVHVAEGIPLDAAVDAVARAEGHSVGAAARRLAEPKLPETEEAPSEEASGAPPAAASAASNDFADDLSRLSDTLESQGYEPRRTGDDLVMRNCPFDSLARDHTQLVCHMNHAYIEGVRDGMGCDCVHTRLDPAEGRCCVTAHLRP